jgi:hypothetical protein
VKAEDYLQTRIDGQISWYEGKSARNKRWYYTCQVIVLICGALIPLVAGYMTAQMTWLKYLTGALGAVVVVFQGLMALKKYKENWLTYRSTAEWLQREKMYYLTNAGDYKTSPDAFGLFVERAENIMSSENSGWLERSKANAQTE